jgi:hypothetical protein
MIMSKAPRFDFTTPVGRLVGGSFFELNKTDHNNKPLEEKKYNWWVGLAFPKTAANWWEEQGELGAVFTAIRSAAGFYTNGEASQPTFAWKIINGDDPKHAAKEGYPGHWVIGFSRNVAIDPCPIYKYPENTAVIDPQQAKRGYYYRISGSSSSNESTGNQAGVYINMYMAQLCFAGQEIISGPAPSSVFNTPIAMPAGASAVPAAPGGVPAPAAMAPVTPPAPGGVPAPAAMAPVTPPAPGGVPAPAAMAPVTPPAPGGVPAPAAMAPVTPPAPAAAPQHVMTAAANGITYEAYRTANWTDEQLIQQGMMLPPTAPANNFLTGNGY